MREGEGGGTRASMQDEKKLNKKELKPKKKERKKEGEIEMISLFPADKFIQQRTSVTSQQCLALNQGLENCVLGTSRGYCEKS